MNDFLNIEAFMQLVDVRVKPLKDEIDRLNDVIEDLKKGLLPEEYMPADYFCNKFNRRGKPLSDETFRKVVKQGNVHSYFKFGTKVYNTEQTLKAFDGWRPSKPVFKKRLKKAI